MIHVTFHVEAQSVANHLVQDTGLALRPHRTSRSP